MALLGLERLGIADPRGADRKRLVTYVEIDRCATDAIALVTGCRLGKRALKFRDWGKMAATFVDLARAAAVRVVALEDSRELPSKLYRTSGDEEPAADGGLSRVAGGSSCFASNGCGWRLMPDGVAGYSRASAFLCPRCGEGVNFGRFARR